MSKRQTEIFLTTLLSDLLSQYPQWYVDGHCKIKWRGQPKKMWPEADLVIDVPARRFIIEYDEDSDPGRTIIKYWPILYQTNQVPLTIIQIWKRGPKTGQGYATLAKWMGARLMELYPTFIYESIERKDETSRKIVKKIAEIVEAR